MDVHSSFGLRGNPFSTSPDPDFAYETTGHGLAITHLLFSIEEREGLFLIRGGVGTGKTTIARFIVQQLGVNPKYRIAYLSKMDQRTATGFLRAVNGAFGLPTPFRAADIERELYGFLYAQHEAGNTVVLMIDEAQRMHSQSLHAIHALLNVETAKHKLLQIALFAQTNIINKLEQVPALQSRITRSVFLNDLTETDAIAMLRYRVSVVSDDNRFDQIFPPALHRTIYKASRGVPRELCVLCSSALVHAYARKRKVVDEECLSAAIHDFRAIKFEESENE